MIKEAQTERIKRLCTQFPAWGIDALLLFDMFNIRYLTGFSGTDGILIVDAGGKTHLIVDGRYTTQAKLETRDVNLIHMTDRIDSIVSVLADQAVRVVGFDESSMTIRFYRQLKSKNRRIRFKSISKAIDLLRSVKTEEEIGLIRKAAVIAANALREVLPLIKTGVCERDIALELEYRMRKRGADSAAFDTIIASGPNAALPHARAGFRRIKAGDAVVIDYGAVYQGYHSDETCTFFIERVETDLKAVYGLVKEAHDRAMEAAIAGCACSEVDRVARDIISQAGWGDYFDHGTGHSVGLELHELPRLSPKVNSLLAEGMVVTVEPGVYLPGKWGIRIEDTIRVTASEADVLTKMSKELTVLG